MKVIALITGKPYLFYRHLQVWSRNMKFILEAGCGQSPQKEVYRCLINDVKISFL